VRSVQIGKHVHVPFSVLDVFTWHSDCYSRSKSLSTKFETDSAKYISNPNQWSSSLCICPSVWRNLQFSDIHKTFFLLVRLEILTSAFLKIRSSGMWRWVTARLVQDVSNASQSHEPLTRHH